MNQSFLVRLFIFAAMLLLSNSLLGTVQTHGPLQLCMDHVKGKRETFLYSGYMI
uniref:Uncharacterized protein n=1 Tax=Arundo donax TaxID=35708 RepID=A0A0A9BYX1_ARUDO